jgi:hypothetical protein
MVQQNSSQYGQWRGKKLYLVANCWCGVRQMGKDEDVRDFMIGTWITLNPEFGPEVLKVELNKILLGFI